MKLARGKPQGRNHRPVRLPNNDGCGGFPMMMGGMWLIWILGVVVLALAVAALSKYLGRREP